MNNEKMQLDALLRSIDMTEVRLGLVGLKASAKSEATEVLENLSREQDFALRCRAMDCMVEVMPDQAELLAIRLLKDSDADVRLHAVHALYKLGSRIGNQELARLLTDDPDDLVRSWSALALGELGDESALPSLAIARDRDAGVDHEGRPIRETAKSSIQMIESRLAKHNKSKLP